MAADRYEAAERIAGALSEIAHGPATLTEAELVAVDAEDCIRSLAASLQAAERETSVMELAATQAAHERDGAEARLQAAEEALRQIADSWCTKNLDGECVGPTIYVNQSTERKEIANCAKHFAVAALGSVGTEPQTDLGGTAR